jgi:hypothetical protein
VKQDCTQNVTTAGALSLHHLQIPPISDHSGQATLSARPTTTRRNRDVNRRPIGKRLRNLSAGQPSSDLAQSPRLNEVEECSSIGPPGTASNKSSVCKDAQLAGRRGPAQANLLRDLRGLAVAESDQRNDSSTRRIGQQVDADPIPLWHEAQHAKQCLSGG